MKGKLFLLGSTLKAKLIIFGSITTVLVGGLGATYIISQNSNNSGVVAGATELRTTQKEAPKDGTPLDYSPVDNMAFLAYNFNNAKNYKTTTKGSTTANVVISYTQNIYNEKYRLDDEILTKCISTSTLVNVAEEKYFMEDRVLLRYGSNPGATDASWTNDEPIALSLQGYQDAYGLYPDGISAYIICEESILDSTDIEYVDGYYVMTLHLDPSIAPAYYKNQVKTLGNAGDYPAFSNVELTFTFDASWMVRSIRTIENYTLSMGFTAPCNTDITETFEYGYFDIPDQDYFNQYRNLVPADGLGEKELTSIDYLQNAFSSLVAGEESTYSISGNVNNNPIDLLLSIDLDDNRFKVKAGSLNVLYEGDVAYVSLGNTKVKVAKEAALDLFNSFNLSFDTSSLDTSSILKMFNDAVIVKDGSNVTMQANVNIKDINLPIVFRFNVTEEKEVSLIDINLSVNLSGTSIDVNFKPAKSDFEKVNKAEYQNLDLSKLSSFVKNTVDTKVVNLTGSAYYNDILASFNIDLDFNDDIKAEGTINLKYDTLDKDIHVLYYKSKLYVDMDSVHVYFPLVSYATSKVDLTSFDLGDTINKLFTVDFASLIKSLDTEGGLKVVLNIPTLNDFEVLMKVNGSQINLETEYLSVNLSNDITSSFELQNYDYSNILNGKDLFTNLTALYNSKYFDAKFETNVNGYAITADAYVDVENKNALLCANIAYANKTVALNLILNDNTVYITYNDIKLFFDLNNQNDIARIKSLLSKYLNISFELPKLNLNEVLSYLTNLSIGKSAVEATINAPKYGINNLTIKVSNDLNVSFSEININNIIISDTKASITAADEKIFEELNQADFYNLVNLVDYADSVDFLACANGINANVKFDGTYNNETITANASVLINKGFSRVQALVNVKYMNYEVSNLMLTYEDSNVYLDYNDIHVNLSIDDIKAILAIFDVELKSSTVNTNYLEYADILSSLTFDGTSTNISLNLAMFNLEGLDLSISNVDGLSLNTAYEINGLAFTLDANLCGLEEVEFEELNQTYLTNENETVTALVKNIKDIITAKCLDVNLSLSGVMAEIDFNIDAYGTVNFNDGIINAELNIDLTVNNTLHRIMTCYYDGLVYVKYGNMSIALEVTEISDLVEYVINSINSYNKEYKPESTLVELPKLDTDYMAILKTLNITNSSDGAIISVSLASLDLGIDTISINITNDLNVSLCDKVVYKDVTLSNANISVNSSNKKELTKKEAQNGYDEVIILVDTIFDALKLTHRNVYSIDMNSIIYNNGIKRFDVNANVGILVHEDKTLDLSIDVSVLSALDESGNPVEDSYYATFKILTTKDSEGKSSSYAYITFRTSNSSENEAMKIKMNVKDMLEVLATLNKLLDLNLDFLDSFMSSDIASLDVNNLGKLNLGESLNLKDKLSTITFSDYVNALMITQDKLSLSLNGNALFGGENKPNAKDLEINLLKTNNSINGLTIRNIYSYNTSDRVEHFDMNFNLNDNDVTVEEPADKNSYFDFSSINQLLQDFIHTAEYMSTGYKLSGNANLKLNIIGINFNLTNVPVEIYVKVDENKKPEIHINLTFSEYKLMFRTLIRNCVSEIVYKDGEIYLKRTIKGSSSEYRYQSMAYFLANFWNNFYFISTLDKSQNILGMYIPSKIDEALGINSALTSDPTQAGGFGGKDGKTVIEKTLLGYQYSDNKYQTVLSGEQLTHDSSVGDIDLDIGRNDNKDLTTLYAKMTVGGVLIVTMNMTNDEIGANHNDATNEKINAVISETTNLLEISVMDNEKDN